MQCEKHATKTVKVVKMHILFRLRIQISGFCAKSGEFDCDIQKLCVVGDDGDDGDNDYDDYDNDDDDDDGDDDDNDDNTCLVYPPV